MMRRFANGTLLVLVLLLLPGCGRDGDSATAAPGSAGAVCVWDSSAWSNCRWDD